MLRLMAEVGIWIMLPTAIQNSCIYMTVLFISLCFVVYKAYYLSRVLFYYDESGVWVYRGVFPWSRGVYGVRWRDFEDCLYTTNLIYWFSKGYPVSVRPRFSTNPTIHIPPIHKGREAVEVINNSAMHYIKMSDERAPR